MNYAIAGRPTSPAFAEFARELGKALEARGFERAGVDPREADLVLNLIDPQDPKPFRRRSRGRSSPRSTSSRRYPKTP